MKESSAQGLAKFGGQFFNKTSGPERASWFRVAWSDNYSAQITNHLTEAVIRDALAKWQDSLDRRCRVLGEVIDSLKRLNEQNGIYTSFLLNSISEEEFESATEQYFVEHSSIANPEEIANKIQVLIKFTESDFTVSEVSDMFEVGESIVYEALDKLSSRTALTFRDRILPHGAN